MTRIEQSTIMITGASSGIGKACALELAKRGATVVLVARTKSKLEEIADEVIAAGGSACVVAADLTDPKAVAKAHRAAVEEAGPIEVLINNAGAGNWRFIEETTPDEAMRCMAAPYFSAFYTTREVVPTMLAAQSGHIVNVTSVASFLAWPGATAYTAARWAMRGFTLALRSELRGSGIRVSLATFAKVSSDYFANNPGSEDKIPGAQKLIKVLTPQQVARHVANGIARSKKDIAAPAMLRMLLGVNSKAPTLVRWLAESTAPTRPEQRQP